MDNLFYSHGKLLITGEYFVLKGALAFAMPLKPGQHTKVNIHSNTNGLLVWKSFYKQHLWFHASFNPDNFEIIDTSELHRALFIQNMIIKAFKIANSKNEFNLSTTEITNNLEFDPFWGLGSSSTLISNISQWLQINPYELLNNTIGGSGYDIACASSPKPLIYSNIPSPQIEYVNFNPSFLGSLFFVYLGNKVSSAESISKYGHLIDLNSDKLQQINQLTLQIVNSQFLEHFELLLKEHNYIVSDTLNLISVQDSNFPDFIGTIKPLGAWGGDFIMATSSEGEKYVYDYFKMKGLSVIFKYNDLIL